MSAKSNQTKAVKQRCSFAVLERTSSKTDPLEWNVKSPKTLSKGLKTLFKSLGRYYKLNRPLLSSMSWKICLVRELPDVWEEPPDRGWTIWSHGRSNELRTAGPFQDYFCGWLQWTTLETQCTETRVCILFDLLCIASDERNSECISDEGDKEIIPEWRTKLNGRDGSCADE